MLDRLIEILLDERKENISPNMSNLKKADIFRALCNTRPPIPASDEFISLQDKYLKRETLNRRIIDVDTLEYSNNVTLWQGDITRLNSDAIVNACNPALLGCFQPLHNCIDNIIHSYAGIQVRLDCNEIMKENELPNGDVVVTSAYNLPSKYIFHTVGPMVKNNRPTDMNISDLRKCYVNCLIKAKELKLKTVAFCCLSTGVYGYPKMQAAQLAVSTVQEWLSDNNGLKIIFNVFSDKDRLYYEQELSQ